ncbi:MAG: NAD(P)-binding domain-containing protein [Woeseiaceae bacterium]|nr:NAD(P)-binding domain-containing protein [Woeseiaceae bacterium]NIP21789.1 NAD(P)-binding domain-containing protein [Woeseiaceae bacterium]NIS90874.1 NAD(P)-binding domain-containing protein [Woeseiaceae bacterium]
MDVPYIDHAAVSSALRMEDLIPRVRQAMIDFSAGRVEQPARRILAVKPWGGFFGGMPAVTPDSMGAKLVSFYPGNAERQLDTHMALIVLFEPETGRPLVTMDGRLITKMRTAAVTAAYVDAVARPDVRSLAILGAGEQAESHFEALSIVRQFEDVRIWNRTAGRAAALAEKIGARVTNCEDAVRDADVLIAATASTDPVFDGDWLRPGTVVASVGWAGADEGELDATTMSNTVIVDSRDGALTESGNVRRWNAAIHAELGEILDGKATVDSEATIVFESIGMACQDLAAAELVSGILR